MCLCVCVFVSIEQVHTKNVVRVLIYLMRACTLSMWLFLIFIIFLVHLFLVYSLHKFCLFFLSPNLAFIFIDNSVANSLTLIFLTVNWILSNTYSHFSTEHVPFICQSVILHKNTATATTTYFAQQFFSLRLIRSVKITPHFFSPCWRPQCVILVCSEFVMGTDTGTSTICCQ